MVRKAVLKTVVKTVLEAVLETVPEIVPEIKSSAVLLLLYTAATVVAELQHFEHPGYWWQRLFFYNQSDSGFLFDFVFLYFPSKISF